MSPGGCTRSRILSRLILPVWRRWTLGLVRLWRWPGSMAARWRRPSRDDGDGRRTSEGMSRPPPPCRHTSWPSPQTYQAESPPPPDGQDQPGQYPRTSAASWRHPPSHRCIPRDPLSPGPSRHARLRVRPPACGHQQCPGSHPARVRLNAEWSPLLRSLSGAPQPLTIAFVPLAAIPPPPQTAERWRAPELETEEVPTPSSSPDVPPALSPIPAQHYGRPPRTDDTPAVSSFHHLPRRRPACSVDTWIPPDVCARAALRKR